MELFTQILLMVLAVLAAVFLIGLAARLAMGSSEGTTRGVTGADLPRFFDPVPALAGGDAIEPGRPVTVAAYDDPAGAHVARLLLEGHGIPVFVADEGLVGMDWFYSNAIGGVKLQVPAPYADEAGRVLGEAGHTDSSAAQIDPPSPRDEPQPVSGAVACPACGSDQVYRVRRHRKWFYASLLLGIPIPVMGAGYECGRCGHAWRG